MSEKASSTYVTFDLVDYDVTKDVGEEKPVEKRVVTKTKSLRESSSLSKGNLSKPKHQTTSLKQRKKNDSKKRLNQDIDATITSQPSELTQRCASLTESVSDSVRKLSRGFAVSGRFKTKRQSKGELAVTMLSQNNDATTEHEQREAPNKLNCKSRSRSFHFKPSKSSTPSYSRSLSASSRFATLKIFRKKSLSKIISDWKSDDNDDDLTSSSDYVLSPPNTTGILKIYVGSLSLGSNYKSILVTVKTTSKNALRMILERYNIPPSNIDRYILCEVTGKVVQETLTENSKRMTKSKSLEGMLDTETDGSGRWIDDDFVEDYIRPLSDDERPLTLQGEWKLEQQETKRFEVRRRSKIFMKQSNAPIGGQSRDRHRQSQSAFSLRKLSHGTQVRNDSDCNKITTFDSCCSFDEFKASVYQDDVAEVLDNDDIISCEFYGSGCRKTPRLAQSESVASDERVTPDGCSGVHSSPTGASGPGSILPSSSLPYMLTLQGNEEVLIHFLNKPELVVGSGVTDFKLTASDIQPQHCIIYRELEVLLSDANISDVHNHWSVSIAPLNSQAKVWINGLQLRSRSALTHGDLVSVGKCNLFMFKDPLHHALPQNAPTQEQTSFSSGSLENASKDTELPRELNSGSASTISTPSTAASQTTKTCLKYPLNREDDVVNLIFDSFTVWGTFPTNLPLSPAHLYAHCIIYSCLNLTAHRKLMILEKVSSKLYDMIKAVAANIHLSDETTSLSAAGSVDSALSPLQPVIFWMSNAIELLNFCKFDLNKIMRKKVKKERKRAILDASWLDKLEEFTVSGKVVKHLEDSIAIAFQKIVVFTRQLLQTFLPAVLCSNPFTENKSRDLSVMHAAETFTQVCGMLRKYDVTHRISEQLLSYLLSFTNAFLFNILMEKGSSKRFYSWESGIRIRGNLDILETWAMENGLATQSLALLAKISALANLLATPKDQLLKSTWAYLRSSFHPLTPGQIGRVLDGYHVPSHKMTPSWKSRRYVVDEKSANDDVMIEFQEQIPPLRIPASSSSINPKILPPDPFLQNICKRVKNLQLSEVEPDLVPTQEFVREQPDGRDDSQNEATFLLSSAVLNASTVVETSANTASNPHGTDLRPQDAKTGVNSRPVHRNDVTMNYEPLRNGFTSTATDVSLSSKSTTKAKPKDVVSKDNAAARLPAFKPALLRKSPGPDKYGNFQASSSGENVNNNNPLDDAQDTPKNIDVVNVKICQEGLGLGFVDGMETAVRREGIYIRFLLPENTPHKDVEIEHHEFLRCLPLDGKLKVGDRILAADGVSFLDMTYKKAMTILQQSQNEVRLLVKQAGHKAATRILLPKR